MPSVIVLDLDDTLYLERDYASSGYRAVGRWLRQRYGITGFAERAERQFEAGNHRHVFDSTLAELGLAPTPPLIAELVSVYRSHVPSIRLLADAERLIEHRRAGTSLALLTDGFLIAQRNKIRALGLRGKGIWPIVCTDVWGAAFWKPHRRGYDHVAGHFAARSTGFVYVADNPAKDFVAPRALGWATVQVRRPDGIHRENVAPPGAAADLVIETLDELTESRIEVLLGATSVVRSV